MTKLQRQLDTVITNVEKRLAQNQFIVPVKTEQGILIGNVLMVSKAHLKDLYFKGDLVYPNISLNKVAVKVANLMAINPVKYSAQIKELIAADIKFGQALADYAMFKDRYNRAKGSTDQFKKDLYMARMCFCKDAAENYKKYAHRLAQ